MRSIGYLFFGFITVVIASFGYYVYTEKGLASRLGNFEEKYLEGVDAVRGPIECLSADCLTNIQTKKLLIWGDSHANALGNAAMPRLIKNGIEVIDGTLPGCVPLVVKSPPFNSLTQECKEHNEKIWSTLEASQVDYLVLHARWPLNVHGTRFGIEFGVDRKEDPRTYGTRMDYLNLQLSKVVKLSDKTIVILSIPEQVVNVPESYAVDLLKQKFRGGITTCPNIEISLDDWKSARWLDFEESEKYYTVDPIEMLCDGKVCSAINDVCVPRYTDSNHLNTNTYLDLWIYNVELYLD